MSEEAPEPVKQIAARLRACGIDTWLVGGALRDGLLGREIRDWDLVADAPLARVAASLPGAVGPFAQTPVVLIPEVDGAPRIEITSFREGSCDLAGDLARRDFTINAIARVPGTGEWIDPLGGRADLEARCLRAPRPDHAFADDAIRVLRAVRLAAELGFTIEPETDRALRLAAHDLASASAERVRDELIRIVEVPAVGRTLRALHERGALVYVLPALARLVGREHPDGGDAFERSLALADRVRNALAPRLAALFHAAALADTPDVRHVERRSAHLVERAAIALRFSRREVRDLACRVRTQRIEPARLQTPTAMRRMLRRVGREILADQIELARERALLADEGVRAEWVDFEARLAALLEREPDAGAAELAIGGRDVISACEVRESRDVGRWLARAQRHVLENPEANTRDLLVAWLRARHMEA